MSRLLGYLTAVGAGVVALSRLTVERSDPAGVAVAGLRYIALGLGWYLLVVFGCALLARLTRSTRLVRAVDLISLPGMRSVLHGAVGVSLLGGVLAGAPAAAAAPESPPPPVMRMLSDAAAPTPAPAPPMAEAIPPPLPADEWLVRPGDHLWSIAERRLAAAWAREPSDAETVVYWHRLIEINRDRLRSGDPDLIFPGEQFVLPPVQ